MSRVLRETLLFILLAVVFSSCTRINVPKEARTDFVNIFGEGSSETPIYSLDSSSTNIGYLFNQKQDDSLARRTNSDFQLKIKQINEKRLLVQLWNQQGDSLTKLVKGKYSGKAFRVKTGLFVNGNPLVWGIGTSDNIIAKNKTGELVIYHHRGGFGFFTILPIMGASSGLDIIRLSKVE
ncbi:hypothetical protein [Rufibacter sp. XAAS-G3-1]|uniref:hypothetical protein n=1 Tax=Rufibacter sp. XAAS-G3-1 TaxID=2729134 RepID=UPI0015E6B06C|nr:hypothetical protein [Rufibacter sp. XAAS-G3-1]